MNCRSSFPVVALLAALCLIATGAVAQEYGQADRFDVSPPLEQIGVKAAVPNAFATEIPLKVPPARANQKAADQAQVEDPLRQDRDWLQTSLAPTPAPSLSFEGLSDDDNAVIAGTRIVPPDTQGDVGKDYYVQWINLIFAIYSKDGSDCADGSGTPGCIATGGGPFVGNSLWSGFGGVCESTNNGDPIVIYDHLADRWFYSQFAINFGTQCVAVSQTDDPRGPYFRYAFVVSPGEQNDYPKFGLMPDSYYLSLRDFPSSPTFAGAVAIDRQAMLGGDPNTRFVKFSLACGADCVDGFQPPHLEGPPPAAGTPGIFTKVWDDDFDGPVTGSDGYRLWQFDVDWSVAGPNPPASFNELPIVPSAGFNNDMCGFFNRNCIQQASATQRLDPIDELQMFRAQYRHWGTYDSMVVSTTVDATGTDVAGTRWAELRNNGSGWTLHQEGTYAPADGENRWMSSLAMDGDGNIALGYSVSSASTDPSIRYTSRMASDALGTMPGGEVELIAGAGAQLSANRWGDYASMSVDPVNDCTFWFTTEYYANTEGFDFKSRIGAFTLEGCNTDRCGNGFCQPTESCTTCPADCDIPTSGGGAVCGNGICEAGDGEDCVTCAADCAGQQKGNPSNRFCCGAGGGTNPVGCGDARCTSGGFACTDTPVGGGGTACCGDGICDPSGDECGVCDLDCAGNSICGGGGGGNCVPTSSKEKGPRCSDGIDNDCDGLIDGADPDC